MYRVMMYANSLLIVQARNYTESVLHICLFQGYSGLTYSKSILVNRCKCTVQLTADTGRELSTPLVSIHALECIPLQKLSVVQTYCCSFYGSNIWNLYSEYAYQTYRSWNTTVKVCWNLPQPIHTYFVKNFSAEFNSVKVLLLRRFAQSILHSWNPLIWEVGSISADSLQ